MSVPSSPERAQHIVDLLADFIERREAGEAITAESFAQQHPDLEVPLLEALRRVAATERLLGDGERAPDTIGAYQIVGPIGRGGSAHVLRAVAPTGEQVAVKVLTAIARLNARALSRFEREALLLRQLDHPGIVRVRDSGMHQSAPFLVMDLVEGCDLEQSAKQRSLGFTQAAAIVARVARAVAALHERGLLHRDIKPANVILDPSGAPVLVDFGLAVSEDAETITQSGDVLGTPHYMAPEQARGEMLDVRSDVYGLGAVLYALLCGCPPHSGRDSFAVLDSVRRVPATPAQRRRADLPAALVVILEHALAFQARHRYASAEALAQDLDAFVAGRPIQARPMRTARAAAWLAQRRKPMAVTFVLASLMLVTVSSWPTAADRAETLRRAIDRATMAWAANDLETASVAAREVLALDAGHAEGEFLLHLAQGSLMVNSNSAAVNALIEGEGHRRGGRPHAAVEAFQRAVLFAPHSPLPIVLLGRAMSEAGDARSREGDLRAAIAAQPGSAALEREFADVLYRQEKYDEADTHYHAALQLDDQQPMLHFERARNRFFARGADAGLAVARVAAGVLGDRAADEVVLSYAELLNRQKQCAMAHDLLLELLPRYRESARLHHAIGVSFDSQDQIVEAREWYERALELDPHHRMTLLYLSHLHAGANRKTCAHCEQFFRDHPDYYDPERVETYLTRLVGADRGTQFNFVQFAVDLCKRVDRTDALRRLLLELQQAHSESEAHRENLARALKKLDSD